MTFPFSQGDEPGSEPTLDQHNPSEYEVMPEVCQLTMALVAISEYRNKLIRIAAELHDFAPLGALEVMKVYSGSDYEASILFDRVRNALGVRSPEE